MPITTSAKKAFRQNKTRRARNLVKKEGYKKLVVKYRKLVVAKSIDEAKGMLPLVFKALDKAAKTNVIAKNKASRLKSRLSQLIAKSTKTSS
ncbi:MAG TPA: 30S ribosomal protein S20 [Candidatus Paceibacterota bacterium]|nr:30S ribosomal protein S20 [Candidatus Paceibacterota bacterium]